MDEDPKKSHKLPSMLEISEMFDKVQNRINSLSYNFEKSSSLLGIASQYEHLNSAASIADMASKAAQPVDFASVNVVDHSALVKCAQLRIPEAKAYHLVDTSSLLRMTSQYEHFNSAASIVDIASKAVQPVDFASSSVVDQSVIAMNAQLRAPEAIAMQDTFLEMTKGMSAYNNSLMSVKERMIQSIGGTSIYEDMMASANLVRKSIEPYRSAFDAVRTSFEASESFKVARELQSQAFLAHSLSSEYSSVFKQFESLHNLESFKAITRLKNFPFEDMARIDLDSTPDLEENLSETIVELDSEISDEISLVDDFNELSEEKRTVLLGLYQVYYYPIILNCLFMLMWLQVFLDEKLDLTKNTFIFVEKSKEKLSYITNVYRPNPSAMIDNFVVGGSLMLLAKILGW